MTHRSEERRGRGSQRQGSGYDGEGMSQGLSQMKAPAFQLQAGPIQRQEKPGICEPPLVVALRIFEKSGNSGTKAAIAFLKIETDVDAVLAELMKLLKGEARGTFARYLARFLDENQLKARFNQASLLTLMNNSTICAPDCWEKHALATAALGEAGIKAFNAADDYQEEVREIGDGEKGERLIVVGSEEHYEGFTTWRDAVDWAPGITGDQHNKLMFMEHAISKVEAYAQARAAARKNGVQNDDKITVMIYPSGYTKAQMAAFKKSVQGAGADKVITLGKSSEGYSAADQMVNYINTGDWNTKLEDGNARENPIYNLDMIAHGLPGQLAFGLDGPHQADYQFDKSHAAKLSPEAFSDNAAFISYACRTGTESGGTGTNGSLAQSIADNAEVDVYSRRRRTLFSAAFNDGGGAKLSPQLAKAYTLVLEDPRYRRMIDDILFDSRGASGAVRTAGSPGNLPGGEWHFQKGKKPTKR